jgi:hypothetical protein
MVTCSRSLFSNCLTIAIDSGEVMNKVESPPTFSSEDHQSPQRRNPSTVRRVATILAAAMVLPAGGMAFDGFYYSRPFVGLLGLVMFVTLGIGYFLILRQVLKET